LGAWATESSNLTSSVNLAVYQLRRRISATVSGCGKTRSRLRTYVKLTCEKTRSRTEAPPVGDHGGQAEEEEEPPPEVADEDEEPLVAVADNAPCSSAA